MRSLEEKPHPDGVLISSHLDASAPVREGAEAGLGAAAKLGCWRPSPLREWPSRTGQIGRKKSLYLLPPSVFTLVLHLSWWKPVYRIPSSASRAENRRVDWVWRKNQGYNRHWQVEVLALPSVQALLNLTWMTPQSNHGGLAVVLLLALAVPG